MKYVVVRYFTDEQDGGYLYHEGDPYPRDGVYASDLRIKDLMNGNNPQGVPLIKIQTGDATFINSKVVSEEVKKPVEVEVVETPQEVEEPKEVVPEEAKEEETPEFTAEEIDKMPFMKLKKVAKENGVGIEGKEAKDIRSELKEKMEL